MSRRTSDGKAASCPELLLPAGDAECVRAAVCNGADAVYLGGKLFSARQNAENFSRETLAEAVSYCHARGVRVYQTLNTLLFDSQFEQLAAAVEDALDAGVDAFIVQDWGVLRFLRELLRGVAQAPRLHGSTQMSVHTPAGAALLGEMGCRRVVLARELSLEEIRAIAGVPEMETEVFVHGALCMSVSGQCYLSGMLGGRSGNRGCCAGTCRLPFTAENRRPAEEYALSLKDLCLTEHLDELKAAGVSSLKVEGRMKRPEYVAAAAAAYRDALAGRPCDMETLRAVFSRSGFTDGYLTGRRTDLFGTRQKEDVTAATEKLFRALRHTYQAERGHIPLSLCLTCRMGCPSSLRAWDSGGHAVEISGREPLPAQGKPLAETAAEALGKLGGTPFVPGTLELQLEEGTYLPAAELNRMRREACEAVLALRGAPPKAGRMPDPLPQPSAFHAPPWKPPRKPPGEPPREAGTAPRLRARFLRWSQVPADWTEQVSEICLPADEVWKHAQSLSGLEGRVLVEPDRFYAGREETVRQRLLQLRERGFGRVVCENIGHLALARELSLEAHGGAFLNCTNSWSAAELAQLGMQSQMLSFEGNLRDLRKVRADIPLGAIVYGRLPLMLLRSCPVRHSIGCARCGGQGGLTDRKGVRFPALCRDRQFVELLNSAPLWLADRLEEWKGFAVHALYFTGESAEQCRTVLERYRRGDPPEEGMPFTRGLYYREI